MRVLIVHNRYRSLGGEDAVVDREAAALEDAGHLVERFERSNDEIDTWGALRKAALAGRVLWSGETRRALTEILRARRPDVVHLHNTFPLLSPSVLYACRHQQVAAVVTFHNFRLLCPGGNLFRDGVPCRDCLGGPPLPAVCHGCYHGSSLATVPVAAHAVAHRRAWRTFGSAYVFPSHSEHRVYRDAGWPEHRSFVKANLVPAPEPTDPEPRDTVAYIGRLSPEKGVTLLMEAWERLTGSDSGSLRLVIAGGGPLEGRVRSWAANRSSVDVLGMLDRRGCAGVLARARALVAPSLCEETFGMVVVEAMAAGVPPVAAAHGPFPEIVTDGVDGTLFEAGSPAALARALRDVAGDPRRYERMGRQALQTYRERFNPARNLERLLSIYRFAVEHPVYDHGGSGDRGARLVESADNYA